MHDENIRFIQMKAYVNVFHQSQAAKGYNCKYVSTVRNKLTHYLYLIIDLTC